MEKTTDDMSFQDCMIYVCDSMLDEGIDNRHKWELRMAKSLGELKDIIEVMETIYNYPVKSNEQIPKR